MVEHRLRREGDEWACSCGLRWGVGEDDPHGPVEAPVDARTRTRRKLFTSREMADGLAHAKERQAGYTQALEHAAAALLERAELAEAKLVRYAAREAIPEIRKTID